jgi:hypothetical protein
MLTAGQAPAVDFDIEPRGERFAIVWQTTAVVEAEVPAAAPSQPRKVPVSGHGPRAKYAPPVEPGTMPEKPVLTAAGFAASYQKRIDRLTALAAAGDFDAVAAYEIKGKNTYSKMVRRFRDPLAAARPA